MPNKHEEYYELARIAEEPEISVPAENSIEYDGPQIEIPDTGSKKPFGLLRSASSELVLCLHRH